MRKQRSTLKTALAPLARPPGLASVAFLVIGGAVAANALYWQHATHPAPLFATRRVAAEEGAVPAPVPRAAPRGPLEIAADRRPAPPDEPQPVSGGDVVVAAVQAGLASGGFYDGPLDGLDGPRTEAAVRSFQRAHGIEETGRATPDLLSLLEEGSSDGEAAEPAADPQVMRVQRALSDAAYGPLAVDGVFGEETRSAIRRFQLEHGMRATGEIDDPLVAKLKAVGALGGT